MKVKIKFKENIKVKVKIKVKVNINRHKAFMTDTMNEIRQVNYPSDLGRSVPTTQACPSDLGRAIKEKKIYKSESEHKSKREYVKWLRKGNNYKSMEEAKTNRS